MCCRTKVFDIYTPPKAPSVVVSDSEEEPLDGSCNSCASCFREVEHMLADANSIPSSEIADDAVSLEKALPPVPSIPQSFMETSVARQMFSEYTEAWYENELVPKGLPLSPADINLSSSSGREFRG